MRFRVVDETIWPDALPRLNVRFTFELFGLQTANPAEARLSTGVTKHLGNVESVFGEVETRQRGDGQNQN